MVYHCKEFAECGVSNQLKRHIRYTGIALQIRIQNYEVNKIFRNLLDNMSNHQIQYPTNSLLQSLYIALRIRL